MSDYSELKRLAEAATIGDKPASTPIKELIGAQDAFRSECRPEKVLALIAENERLTAWRVSGGHLLKASNARLHEVSVACATAEQERDQLRAEVAGLRTGYESYERVNAELKAESERIERNRDMWKGQVELQAKELTSMHKDAEQWRALVGRAKDPVIGYTGCVICGSADHGGWSCQNHPGGKS